MKDPNKKLELNSSLSIKVESSVADCLKAMSTHMQIPQDEMVNTALKRYIATHSDFLPPRKKESK